jgi:hypothetical protein
VDEKTARAKGIEPMSSLDELLPACDFVSVHVPLTEETRGLLGAREKTEVRTREALVEAMGTAISAVTAQDARGFFEHSGYRLQIQTL